MDRLAPTLLLLQDALPQRLYSPMGSASPSLAEALASQATDLGLQGTSGRTTSRLRNVSMRVPDRYEHPTALSLLCSTCQYSSVGGCSQLSDMCRRPKQCHARVQQIASGFRRYDLCCRVPEAGVPARQPPLRTGTVPFVFPPAGRNIAERTTASGAMHPNQDTIAGRSSPSLMLSSATLSQTWHFRCSPYC